MGLTKPAAVPAQKGGGTVSNLERDGAPAGCRPVAGMKKGWFYRPADRMIVHQQNAESAPLAIGRVPKVIGQISHLTDDGESIRIEYLVLGHRQRRARIVNEDELDRGTWAAKIGFRRPTGNDERHAYARLIREEGEDANVIPARTYYDEEGSLVFPSAEAQTLGYRVLRGSEEEAREAWEEIVAWTTMDGKSALVLGAMMVGPILDSLDVLAHVLNCYGPGQQGKSTVMTVACAILGDLKPRRQQLMMTWNSSKQGITQSLRMRGFLPLGLDEHSSSGRSIKESAREISQMVSGAVRAMGTADGSPRESDGFWLSLLLSTSNEQLKFAGQTEDLATRLQEISAPFYPDRMVLADGSPAPAGHHGAEHVAKRLKRLAKNFGGWPLEWAIRKDMFHAKNLAQLKKLHLELTAKNRPATGGISATIAELHMAWVVGAHMLGEAIGVPGLGEAAEAEALARLNTAIEVAAEANVPDCERLWTQLDSLRIEAATFPEMEQLLAVAEEGRTKLRGFHNSAAGHLWVTDPVVRQAAEDAGIDNLTAALRVLDDLGVHIRGDGKNAQRQTPKALREKTSTMPRRMHLFNINKAAEHFDPEDAPEGGGPTKFPCGPTPGPTPGPTQVGPENMPLTCDGPTGPTGPTLSLFTITREGVPTPEPTLSIPAPATSPEEVYEDIPGFSEAEQNEDQEHVAVAQAPATAGRHPWAPAGMYQPGDEGFDAEFLKLAMKAKGTTASALAFGVLGNGYMYLPNHKPVAVPLPGNVDEVPELMRQYGLKTLWVHEEAATALELPTYADRVADLVSYKGPQSPSAHAWVTPGSGSSLVVQGGGLSAWVTLKPADGRRLSLAFPLYEDRFDSTAEKDRAGWGAAATPAILLDSLMVYLLATQHGSAEWPKVHPYYLKPNATAIDFAGGDRREDVVSEAIRNRQVPVVSTLPALINMQWSRDPQAIGDGERKLQWIHQYDKNAAWLAALGSAWLGIGDPTHYPQGTGFKANKAGYWRLANLPDTATEMLPELRFLEAEDGGHWARTPAVGLLQDRFPGWAPEVTEAWVWTTSKRALYGMYDKLRLSRERILAAQDAGHPGARYAKQVVGKLYQSFRGYLGRTEGPQKDHSDPTGQALFAGDIYWRPDWAEMILDLALANTYRDIAQFADSGQAPLSLKVDAVTLASDEADPVLAAPASMKLGTKGGQWKPEHTAPFGELLPAIDSGKTVPKALANYLSAKES
ncbi:DUF927 domain-containing protein [Streptomyces sp. NPDC054956]